MADLAYECPNPSYHGPHLHPQGFCEGVAAPPPVICPGSGKSWIWERGAAVCQKCYEPATHMGIAPPRRHSGAFTKKVPTHVAWKRTGITLSKGAQIELLKAERDSAYELLHRARGLLDGYGMWCKDYDDLMGYGSPVGADNKT